VKRRTFATKWYIALCILVQPIVRNRVGKLDDKTNFSERGLKGS